MAITATFNNITEAISQTVDPIIIKGDSTLTANDKFYYEVVVKLGSDIIFSGNYPFNSESVVLTNIFNILKNVFKADENAAFNLPLSGNVLAVSSDGNNIKYVTVEISEYYSASATTSPTKGLTSTINKPFIYSFNYAPTIDLLALVPTTLTDGKFLTDSHRRLKVNLNEFKTLSFLFGTGTGEFIVFDYYDASNALLTRRTIDLGSEGILTPTSQATANNFIKTFGVGLANFERMTETEFKPSEYPTLDYYEVYLVDDQVDLNIRSEKFRFDLTCEEGVTIRFVNYYGVWDSYTFRSYKKKTVNQTKDSYRANGGNYQGANYTETKRHLTDFNIENQESIIVKSGYIDEVTRDFLYQLFVSEDVRIIENGVETPINLVSSSYPFDFRKFKALIEIDFEFKYSRKKW